MMIYYIGDCMYQILETLLIRKRIKKKDLANFLNIQPTTLSFKLNGKSDFTLKECKKICELLETDMDISELFKE